MEVWSGRMTARQVIGWFSLELQEGSGTTFVVQQLLVQHSLVPVRFVSLQQVGFSLQLFLSASAMLVQQSALYSVEQQLDSLQHLAVGCADVSEQLAELTFDSLHPKSRSRQLDVVLSLQASAQQDFFCWQQLEFIFLSSKLK
jgi:hypothetical protein